MWVCSWYPCQILLWVLCWPHLGSVGGTKRYLHILKVIELKILDILLYINYSTDISSIIKKSFRWLHLALKPNSLEWHSRLLSPWTESSLSLHLLHGYSRLLLVIQNYHILSYCENFANALPSEVNALFHASLSPSGRNPFVLQG